MKRCVHMLLFFTTLLCSYGFAMDEPSGLVLVGDKLYTVNDAAYGRGPDNKIYQLDLSGKVLQTFYAGDDAGNFEAITFHQSHFYLLSEDGRIYKYDRAFRLVSSFLLSRTILGYVENENSGFEGMTSDGKHLFVSIEKGNKYLIRIDERGEELAKWDLGRLGLKDISDISYDALTNCFFVISHESSAIAIFHESALERNKAIRAILTIEIPGKPKQAEGIAIDGFNIYVVSDRDGRFISFAKPSIPEGTRR